MLPLALAASRDDLEVLTLSEEAVKEWATENAYGNIDDDQKAQDIKMLTEDLHHNVNEQDHQGLSALHWAVLGRPKGDDERHSACVKILLENKADPDMFSGKGWTPLHYAMSSGDLQGARVLLEEVEGGDSERPGASIEVQDPFGQTPLHRATIAGKDECLRLLLQNPRCTSDTVNIKDDMGRTALHWACLHNRREMVTMCIKKGVNIGIIDKSGRMAEQLAEQKGHRELVAWLNDGAFPKSENPHLMKAAAHVKRNARERSMNKLVETLKEKGLEEEAQELETTRDEVLAETEIVPATHSVPSYEVPKVDLAPKAEAVRALIVKLKDKPEEGEGALTAAEKVELNEELDKVAEDLAPAAI